VPLWQAHVRDMQKDVAERIWNFLAEHQKAREAARERLPEFGIKV